MEKWVKPEGSPAAKLVQLVREVGRNKDVTIDLGTVKSPDPNLAIQLDSDGLLLEKGDMILTSTVLAAGLVAGDKVIVFGDDDTQFYYVIDKAVIY